MEIRLFVICEAMKWSHLPSAGGLYDQRAGLIDRFHYIFQERNKYEEQEEKKKKAKEMGPTPKDPNLGARRPRR